MNPSKNKPVISEHEAEELIKGMGRVAAVVVHDNGLVIATAISTNPSDIRIQNEVDGLLHDIQRKYRIVKKESEKNGDYVFCKPSPMLGIVSVMA